MKTLNLLLFAATAWFLTSCDRKAPGSATQHSPLRVAAYYWPGEFWVDIANDKGWFKEAGLDTRIIDTNPNYFASFKDTVEGRIDVNALTLFDVMLLNDRGAGLVCIANTDQTAGADGIAARAGIDEIAGLKGKRVGVSVGTYGEYMLSVVLAREGIALADLTLVDMPGEKAAEELVKAAVDAVVTWEPVLSEAVEKAKGKKLWDTSNLPGVSPAVLVTRRQVLRERPDDVQKLMRVWHRATEFIEQNPNESYAIVARVNKKKVEEVREFAKADKILGLRENLNAFSYAAGFESLHGAARVMNDFLIKQKLATNRLDSADFLDARFLKALK